MIEQEFFDFSLRQSPVDYDNLSLRLGYSGHFLQDLFSYGVWHFVQAEGDARDAKIVVLIWQIRSICYFKSNIRTPVFPSSYLQHILGEINSPNLKASSSEFKSLSSGACANI